MNKSNRFWALIILSLIGVIAVSGTIAWSKYSPGAPIEIILKPALPIEGNVYVSGAVNNPGGYPLKNDDTIKSLIQAAGGVTGSAESANFELRISKGEQTTPQKININRAELWLLKALPGIGDVKAKAIIDYRQQSGPFRNILELTRVDGISHPLFEQVKDLITVSD
ncbi:MAG: ComEA family DNA-binding protein [Chloroflexi bacterium]|nr:ComEA family DNA-binding protein [Chloroflexota bacterium]